MEKPPVGKERVRKDPKITREFKEAKAFEEKVPWGKDGAFPNTKDVDAVGFKIKLPGKPGQPQLQAKMSRLKMFGEIISLEIHVYEIFKHGEEGKRLGGKNFKVVYDFKGNGKITMSSIGRLKVKGDTYEKVGDFSKDFTHSSKVPKEDRNVFKNAKAWRNKILKEIRVQNSKKNTPKEIFTP